MSKLDELLHEYVELEGNLTLHRAARAELAALRQRAEDAEMIAMTNSVYDDSPWYFQRGSSGQWLLCAYMDDPRQDVKIPLVTNSATGLPILTDEARKALGEKR